MVALLHPNSPLPSSLALPRRVAKERHLYLVQANASARPSLMGWVSTSVAFGLALVVVFLLGVAGLRTAQGTPPASFELPVVELGGVSGAPFSTGASLQQADDIRVIVAPGQSLWDVARSVNPDGDVRAMVVALAEQNGGSNLRIGQELLIPGSLMG